MKGRWTLVAFGLIGLLNVVLLAAVIAMAAEPSVARSVASPLNLATSAELADLDSRTSDLEIAIGSTFGIDDLTSRVDDLESRLDDLETGTGDQAAESVDDLSFRVDDLGSTVDDLSTRIDDLESQVGDLQAQMDDVCFNLSIAIDFFC